jgi:hypothetical protein
MFLATKTAALKHTCSHGLHRHMSTPTPLQLTASTTMRIIQELRHSRIAPFIPASQASLTINGETIA